MPEYQDAFGVLTPIQTRQGQLSYYSFAKLAEQGFESILRWPISARVLFECVLRNVNEQEVTSDHVRAFGQYNVADPGEIEIPFTPARVLLQDFTGVPAIVDLAAMRSAMARMGGDPARINPQLPVDLVIDHSVQVDHFATPDALKENARIEFQRNRERYEFLRWGQGALQNFRVVPPASGICHQVNLEYLGQVIQVREQSAGKIAYFDSLVGTDSHTPMINGLGVLGWGVGGIEAEAAMLGRPIYMLAPPVVGVKLTGRLNPGVTATDLVLAITEMLRKHGVVGKFVEFYGTGLASMTVPDRATISNMAPEYGATVGYFPIDDQTLSYLYATGRSEELIDTVEKVARAQGVFRTHSMPDPEFQVALELDLASVVPSIAGPKRPQDRIDLHRVPAVWEEVLQKPYDQRGYGLDAAQREARALAKSAEGAEISLSTGDVVIAAITSCTNTSNPAVLMAAGLLARNAVEKGLSARPGIKTSFAPGSMVVTDYLQKAGLMPYLEKLGFYLVGYGCTTCIGNSGPLPQPIAQAIEEKDLVVAGVLSGNRNFEGRINPHTKANFLMSPPLVVAYAIAGNVAVNLAEDPIGTGSDGTPVYLKDIWPTEEDISQFVQKALDRDAFLQSYSGIEESNPDWNAIDLSSDPIYQWNESSTYIQEPPFFVDMKPEVEPIRTIQDAQVLVKVGDSITTDHISPAGAIDPDAPAGRYLVEKGVERRDFNSYGSRRGNDRVMTRGTFANIRLRNQIAPGTEGSFTTHLPTGEVTSIFDAAARYKSDGIPTIVLGGKDYGMGSSRDWAAKGTQLLGVKAVIAESFERIHRSNLVGMGVLPLQFSDGESAETLGLSGRERYTIELDDNLQPRQQVKVIATGPDGGQTQFHVVCRIDSPVEVDYYRNGGILHSVLRRFALESAS